MKWILGFLFTFNAFALTCQDLNSCVDNLAKLTNKKYIYTEKLKGSVESSSNVEINAENADNILSLILQSNGYSRVPSIDKDSYLIVSSKDIRYYPGVIYRADKTTSPNIPKNWDYTQLIYTFKHYLHGQSRETANSLRPFMSRYGRIIDIKSSGIIIVHELNSVMPTILEIARLNDRELSKEEIKRFEETEKERRQMDNEERKQQNENNKKNKNEQK